MTHRALVEWIDWGMKSATPLKEILMSLRSNAVAIMFEAADKEARAVYRSQGKSQRAYYKQLTNALAAAAAKEKKTFLCNCQAAGEMFAQADRLFNDHWTLEDKLREANMRFIPRVTVTEKTVKSMLICPDLRASSKFSKFIADSSRFVKVCSVCKMKSCSGCRTKPLPELTEDPAFEYIRQVKSIRSSQIESMCIEFSEDLEVVSVEGPRE